MKIAKIKVTIIWLVTVKEYGSIPIILQKRTNVKKKYHDGKCNKELDTATIDISELFKNTKQGKKKLYKVIYNPREIFQKPDPSGKSIVTSISFDFKDEGKIILSCYNMDKATNQIDSPIKDINQFDTFRIDIRSRALVHYLEKA